MPVFVHIKLIETYYRPKEYKDNNIICVGANCCGIVNTLNI